MFYWDKYYTPSIDEFNNYFLYEYVDYTSIKPYPNTTNSPIIVEKHWKETIGIGMPRSIFLRDIKIKLAHHDIRAKLSDKNTCDSKDINRSVKNGDIIVYKYKLFSNTKKDPVFAKIILTRRLYNYKLHLEQYYNIPFKNKDDYMIKGSGKRYPNLTKDFLKQPYQYSNYFDDGDELYKELFGFVSGGFLQFPKEEIKRDPVTNAIISGIMVQKLKIIQRSRKEYNKDKQNLEIKLVKNIIKDKTLHQYKREIPRLKKNCYWVKIDLHKFNTPWGKLKEFNARYYTNSPERAVQLAIKQYGKIGKININSKYSDIVTKTLCEKKHYLKERIHFNTKKGDNIIIAVTTQNVDYNGTKYLFMRRLNKMNIKLKDIDQIGLVSNHTVWYNNSKSKNKIKEIPDKSSQKLKKVCIQSTLTKKVFRISKYKAEKYVTKWFEYTSKSDFKKQLRLEKAEYKVVNVKKQPVFSGSNRSLRRAYKQKIRSKTIQIIPKKLDEKETLRKDKRKLSKRRISKLRLKKNLFKRSVNKQIRKTITHYSILKSTANSTLKNVKISVDKLWQQVLSKNGFLTTYIDYKANK